MMQQTPGGLTTDDKYGIAVTMTGVGVFMAIVGFILTTLWACAYTVEFSDEKYCLAKGQPYILLGTLVLLIGIGVAIMGAVGAVLEHGRRQGGS